jgi:hypothetical protein
MKLASCTRVAVGCLLGLGSLAGIVAAQATEGFTATTVNMDPAGEDLKIDLLRWSSDKDRQAVVAVIMTPAEEGSLDTGISALIGLPTLGYVWPSSSGVGYSVKYAHRTETPDGGEHITLVTSRRLGTYGRASWRPTGAANTSIRPFTVIELRLDSGGGGEGKLSAATDIVFDAENSTVALKDYDADPVVLDSVKRVPSR